MSGRGVPVYWNKQRLDALLKLGKAAEKTRGPNGKLDWDYARAKLPAQRKILKDKDNIQLSKAYSRYKYVVEGYCYSAGCSKRRDTNGLYCKSCRKKMKEHANRVRSRAFYKYAIKKHPDVVEKHLRKKTKEELVNMIIDNMNRLPMTLREIYLTKDFKKEILDIWGKK